MVEVRSFEALMAGLRGFQESRTLLTGVELDVFSALEHWGTAAEVAERAEAEPRAMGMLLDALAGLGALEKQGGRYRCTRESRALGAARVGLLHTVNRWHTWSSLTVCVRAGTAQEPEASTRDQAWTENFIAAMEARAKVLAPGLVRQVGTAGLGRMLDVGGGPGTFAIAFAQAEPGLRVEVLDLPVVLPIALEHIRAAGLQDRVTVKAGDFNVDALGSGYDLVLLSAICHMLDEAGNRSLFRRAAQALKPGGRLVVRDFLLEPERTSPQEAALFALNMLVGTRGGSVYTEEEYRLWLEEAGLTGITRPAGEALLVARKALAHQL
jgi:SAM-dependent methyltransferase